MGVYIFTNLDDDIWELVDIDANAQTGDLIEYKTSVLFHNEWIDSEWTKGLNIQNYNQTIVILAYCFFIFFFYLHCFRTLSQNFSQKMFYFLF